MSDSTQAPATAAPPLHVITGATSDVGQAIVRKLARSGRSTLALGRDRKQLSALEREFPGQVQTRHLDLLDDAAVVALAQDLNSTGCHVAGLIHCAGAWLAGPMAKVDVAEMDMMYRVTVHAVYLLTQQLLPALERGSGHVLFINSSAALAAKANLSGYAVSRSGMKALADSMRDELHEHGVRVTSIYLGRTATRLITRVFEAEGRPFKPERLLQPDHVADTVLFVLSLSAPAEVVDIRLVSAIKSY